jgi:hypothetical protein
MRLTNSLKEKRTNFAKGSIERQELNKMLLQAKRLYSRLGELIADYSRSVVSYEQTTKHKEFSARELFTQYNELIKLAS